MAVEAAFRRPQRIYEIEATFALILVQRPLHAGDGVESGGGGEEVGDGCAGDCEPAAFGVDLREEPIGNGVVHGHAKLVQKGDGGGGGGDGSALHAAHVSPRAVGRFEELEALHHAQRFGQFAACILVGTEGDEAAVSVAEVRAERLVVSSVGRAVCLDAREEVCGALAGGGAATSERAEVDEVEPFAIAECGEPVVLRWALRQHCFQSGEREDGVVKVGFSPTVLRAASGEELA